MQYLFKDEPDNPKLLKDKKTLTTKVRKRPKKTNNNDDDDDDDDDGNNDDDQAKNKKKKSKQPPRQKKPPPPPSVPPIVEREEILDLLDEIKMKFNPMQFDGINRRGYFRHLKTNWYRHIPFNVRLQQYCHEKNKIREKIINDQRKLDEETEKANPSNKIMCIG